MKNTIKFLTIAILISISFLAVNAQESTVAVNSEVSTAKVETKKETAKKQSSSDEFYKTEIYGGYSWLKPTETTIAFPKEDSANGYDASITRNFNRFVGVKFATSGNFKTSKDVFGTATDVQKSSFYTYAGGVQFADNRKSSRVRPFAHAMIGGIRFNYKFTSTLGSNVNSSSANENKFLMVFGGGINIRVGKKVSVRPIQFDYLVTNGGLCCLTSNGFVRLGAGMNLNFLILWVHHNRPKKRIKFAKGKSSTTIQGSVLRDEVHYNIVKVSKVQKITVKVTSLEKKCLVPNNENLGRICARRR